MKRYVALVVGVVAYFAGRLVLHAGEDERPSFHDLPQNVKDWYGMGKTVRIHGHKMFYQIRKCTDTNLKNVPTFLLLHGFPSSSFEYHKVLDKLSAYGDVIVNDHIGFGFSDGPTENYTYSLGETAENILAFWKYLGVKQAHIIAHDMGDSVLTEILARRHRGMLPSYFDNFFQSVTFTNGGMNFKMINFRISQLILMYKKLGTTLLFVGRRLGLGDAITKRQLKSLWGPKSDTDVRDQDIEALVKINTYTGASANLHNTIYYLWDRYYFEFRWFQALEKLDIPSRFIWADSDAVSPLSIPLFFQHMVPDYRFTVVEGFGHFWMLEAPDIWVKEMVKVLRVS